MVLETGHPYRKREPGPFPYAIYKNELEMDQTCDLKLLNVYKKT